MLTYRIDWGDGDTSLWSHYAPPGTSVELEHAWDTAGAFAVRAQARGSSGPESDWSAPCTVRVLPLPGYPFELLWTIPLDSEPHALEVSPDGQYLYVTTDQFTVFRTSDYGIVATVPGVTGWAICPLPNGEKVYVLDAGGPWVLRTSDWTVIDSIQISSIADVRDIVAHPNSESVYVSYFGFNQDYVAVVRTSDNQVVGDVCIPDGDVGLAITPDGQRLFVTGGDDSPTIDIIRLSDRAFVGAIVAGGWESLFGAEVSPDGQLLCVASTDDYGRLLLYRTSDYAAVARIPVVECDAPWEVRILASGRFAYVGEGDGDYVAVVDLKEKVVVDEIEVRTPFWAWHEMAGLPDCSRMFFGCNWPNSVAVYGLSGP